MHFRPQTTKILGFYAAPRSMLKDFPGIFKFELSIYQLNKFSQSASNLSAARAEIANDTRPQTAMCLHTCRVSGLVIFDTTLITHIMKNKQLFK